MTLSLNGLEVDCIIGERADERERVQRLVLDISLEIPDDAGRTDALGDTVDYAALAERIRTALARARCQMIERAAAIAYAICREDKRVRSARVSVTKAGAILGLASATITYTGEKHV